MFILPRHVERSVHILRNHSIFIYSTPWSPGSPAAIERLYSVCVCVCHKQQCQFSINIISMGVCVCACVRYGRSPEVIRPPSKCYILSFS